MKLIDTIIFYNEFELLNYRLNTIKNVVDYFIIVESTKTFTGKEKPLYFDYIESKYTDISHKIVRVICDDFIDIKTNEDVWKNEIMQRRYIDKGIELLNLDNNDLIMLSDVDEIPDRKTISYIKYGSIQPPKDVYMFIQDMYYYNLHTIQEQKWHKAKITTYGFYKDGGKRDPEYIRQNFKEKGISPGGWHLSYFGDVSKIIDKLDNYSHQENNIDKYKNEEYIKNRIDKCEDLFQRNDNKFSYIDPKTNSYLPYEYELYLQKYL